MATYAVGDIQGCLQPLQKLLEQVDFSPSRDQLWAAGDLINRGPDSLETLRFLHQLGSSFKAVLGNHDLHFLAVYRLKTKAKKKDTLSELLKAPDVAELAHWLQQFPLIHRDRKAGFSMVHAGIPPIWSIEQAVSYAEEVHHVLRCGDYHRFFSEMYGNTPDTWNESLTGFTRLRVITNYFTRMRFCTATGTLELTTKTGPQAAPTGFSPWFTHAAPCVKNEKIIFGHWASLLGETHDPQFFALDTGCVWGGALTMLELTKQSYHTTDCSDCYF